MKEAGAEEGGDCSFSCQGPSCHSAVGVMNACAHRRKLELTVKEAAGEEGGGASAIRQAYLAACQRELASLYQLMAQLDALAGHPLPAGGYFMELTPFIA